jgi:hypothetical protein
MLKRNKSKRKKENRRQLKPAPMAHACNSSYSGGRDKEDCSSKPAQAKSL